LLDDRNDALHGFLDVGGVLFHLLGLVVVSLHEVEVADDNAEEIVEIVRDALSDGTDRGDATRLGEAGAAGRPSRD